MANKKNTSFPKEKVGIVLVENISEVAVDFFKKSGYPNIRKIKGALTEDQLIKEIKDAHLIGIRSKTRITEKVLRHAEKLQAIGCFCIGVDQVDLKEATRRGVAVFNAPYSNTRSVAELVIGSSIMLIRNILDKNTAAHKGVWLKEAGGSHELRGKTLGIVGYGNIGSQVSVLAESLGMRVVFFDIETRLPLGNAIACKSLKELLQQSDIVTMHVPDLPSTRNLINKNSLSLLKQDAILINYARGGVVDLSALRKFLLDKKLGGAAIDVFPVEPENAGDLFSCPLQGLPNVLLTPHIGGSTLEAQNNIGSDVSRKLFNYLETGVSTGSHSIPALSLPPQANTHRILHIHRNVPGVLSQINTLLSRNKINILGQYLKTNEDIGYVVLDIEGNLSREALDLMKKVPDSIKVRILY
jgi:D-3-phosphoglycerate dehydrogenase